MPYIQLCKLYLHYIFHVEYILSRNPSVTAWIYGAAKFSEIPGICFGKYMSVLKFAIFQLFLYHDTGIFVHFSDIFMWSD